MYNIGCTLADSLCHLGKVDEGHLKKKVVLLHSYFLVTYMDIISNGLRGQVQNSG